MNLFDEAHGPTRSIRECTICGERVTMSNATEAWEKRHEHAPTDDEQEALGDCSCKCGHLYHSECYPRTAEWGGCFNPEPTDDEREARQRTARLIDEMHDDYEPYYNEAGECIGSNIADEIFRRTVQGEPSDEGTLVKVYDALQSVLPDVSEWVIRDQVNAMQNAGILFRERRTVQGEPLPACGYCGDRLGAPGCPAHGEPQPEPSDAAVRAALSVLVPEVDWSAKAMLDANPTWVANMRAALRAAFKAGGEGR